MGRIGVGLGSIAVRTVLILLTVSLPAAVAGQGQESKPLLNLQPDSPWELDYAEDSCALRRKFVSGEISGVLEFRKYSPSLDFELTVLASGLELTKGSVAFQFAPDDDFVIPSLTYTAKFGKEFQGFIVSNMSFQRTAERSDGKEKSEAILKSGEGHGLPPLDPTRERVRAAQIESLNIRDGFERDLSFQTGPMDQASAALDKCIDELITHWGIDAEAHKSLSQPARVLHPERLAQRILTNYPLNLQREGKSAIMRVRMMVDARGKPTACTIQVPSADKDSEATTCKQLMIAARFEPARDVAGQPIPSYYVTTIAYSQN